LFFGCLAKGRKRDCAHKGCRSPSGILIFRLSLLPLPKTGVGRPGCQRVIDPTDAFASVPRLGTRLHFLTLFAHKPPAGDLALWLATYVERSEAIFFAILGWFEGHQRKGSGRKLLPDRQFVGCNRKPAEFEHEPAGLHYLSDLGPSNLRNRQSFPLGLQPDIDLRKM
jgi:hypothetical protein